MGSIKHLGVQFKLELKAISVTMPFNSHSPFDALSKANATNLTTGRVNGSAYRRKSHKVRNASTRRYEARCANDRFLIRKQTLCAATLNDGMWLFSVV